MSSTIEIKKICERCGKEFIARKSSTRYCCKRCAEHAYKDKRREEHVRIQNELSERKGEMIKNPIRDFMTPRQCATFLAIGKSTVYRALASNQIPFIKIGGKTLISRKVIEAIAAATPDYVKKDKKAAEPITEFYTSKEVMEKFGIPGIYGIDTRRLTRALRDKGYMKGAITESLEEKDGLLQEIHAYTISGAVQAVTVKLPETVDAPQAKYRVAVMDYGFPRATLEALTARGCALELLPADYTAKQIQALSVNGIFLSDGPGDPDDNPIYIQNIREMTKLGLPILAIGLGHQMLALSVGAEIEKMAQGHRGSNQPVVLGGTEKFMVTDQNHGYSVKKETVQSSVAEISMTNLNDGSVEGLSYKAFPAISVQFTPNGDRDSSTSWIFDCFVEKLGEAEK